jgi:hypothetical protein
VFPFTFRNEYKSIHQQEASRERADLWEKTKWPNVWRNRANYDLRFHEVVTAT